MNKGDRAYQRACQAFLKRLVQARHDAGLLQEDASKALGKSRNFLSKCELGERRLDVIELQQIAKLYGKTVTHFLDEDQPSPSLLSLHRLDLLQSCIHQCLQERRPVVFAQEDPAAAHQNPSR